MTLTFQHHNPVTLYFGPYLNCCWTNCHQILKQGSLDKDLSKNMWDVREQVTLATIMQKHVFDHNF